MSSKKSDKTNLKKYLKKCLYGFLITSVFGTILATYMLSETTTTQYPTPTSKFYIEDYSGVFTEETENYIMEQAVALNKATKAQIVVVAAPDTQADSLENYSYQIANNWGIGDADLDNGVLILFTTTEPHVRLEIGKGLEGCLPDAKSGRILDTWAVDAKDNGRWNEAAINTFVTVAQEIYAEYGLEASDSLETVDFVNEEVTGTTMADADFPEAIVEKNTAPLWQQILVAFIVFWMVAFGPYLFICFMLYFSSNSVGGNSRSSRGWYYSGRGGGGFGGGGGGFSGGGGSFGGGGASR